MDKGTRNRCSPENHTCSVNVCVCKVIERVLFYMFVTGNEPKTRSLRFKMVINCVIFPFGKE